jgi:zinc D-Ala-D-Ala carboxypeptidase
MKLSENFTLEELTATNVNLPNHPTSEQISNLQALVTNVLQPLRELYGKAIKINSGFRSKAVNKKVGGAPTSQHTKGEAADIDCDNPALLYRLIRDTYEFDQLIWEKGNDNQPAWVHVSFSRKKNRKQILRIR